MILLSRLLLGTLLEGGDILTTNILVEKFKAIYFSVFHSVLFEFFYRKKGSKLFSVYEQKK